jgi:sec-independent protein translocase protein TatA
MDGIIVLVVVVMVLFGSTQIPKLARSLGSAQKEFKKGVAEGGSDSPTTVTVAAPANQALPASHVVVSTPGVTQPAGPADAQRATEAPV